MMKKWYSLVLIALINVVTFYGLGRAYFYFTDGFTIANITSEMPYDARWKLRSMNESQALAVEEALSQPYHYMGKGCQSYVFLSEDEKYIIKFIKYQRFRNHIWVDWLRKLPPLKRYYAVKDAKKRKKLENIFNGWVIAYHELQPETGVIYVHLNKTPELGRILHITDKMGVEHDLPLDDMEFLVQKKATMLTDTIATMMQQGEVDGVKLLVSRLMKTILNEFERGISDNDQALMQNTGVLDGVPIHIDLGQFVYRDDVQNPQLMKQQLFNRTYLFNQWLHKRYPEVGEHLDELLYQVIGPQISELKYQVKDHEIVWGWDDNPT